MMQLKVNSFFFSFSLSLSSLQHQQTTVFPLNLVFGDRVTPRCKGAAIDPRWTQGLRVHTTLWLRPRKRRNGGGERERVMVE